MDNSKKVNLRRGRDGMLGVDDAIRKLKEDALNEIFIRNLIKQVIQANIEAGFILNAEHVRGLYETVNTLGEQIGNFQIKDLLKVVVKDFYEIRENIKQIEERLNALENDTFKNNLFDNEKVKGRPGFYLKLRHEVFGRLNDVYNDMMTDEYIAKMMKEKEEREKKEICNKAE
jgi:hypothetical protein